MLLRHTEKGVNSMRKRKKAVKQKILTAGEKLIDLPMPIVTDPNGSYTGRPMDPYERPIQDADDL